MADQPNNDKKCGQPGDANRVIDLRGNAATEENCKLQCLENSACKAFSGIWNDWCIGCSVDLDETHSGAVAFKKVAGKSPFSGNLWANIILFML